MALVHRTIVGGIQIDRTGNVFVILKLIVADGFEEFGEANHRFLIEKGESVTTRLSVIDTFLASKGRQTIPARASTVIKNTAEACWQAMDA